MPYPTATIFVPWHALGDEDGLIDVARLPPEVARTDANETFDADLAVVGNVSAGTLDVSGDVYCGEDLGTVGDVASGGDVSAAGDVRAAGAIYERGRSPALGEWVAVAYNAGHFTASAGSWTVTAPNVVTYAYTLIGKTLILLFQIDQTNISAAPAYLYLSLQGYTAARATRTITHVFQNGVASYGLAFTVVGSGLLGLATNLTSTAWATTAGNDAYVYGQIALEIQ